MNRQFAQYLRKPDEAGATTVEGSLTVVTFILLIFTTVQVAILITAHLAATEAVASVARETAAIGDGMVTPYSCGAHAQARLQEELNRYFVPAQVTTAEFPAAVDSNGIPGYELQTTIQVQCPLCFAGSGLNQSLSTIRLKHFVAVENYSSCT